MVDVPEYPESFADHPLTFGERRSDKVPDNSATVWKPRDALINLLRRIDKGEIDIDVLCMAYRMPGEARGISSRGYLQASPDNETSIGVLFNAMQMIARDGQ